MITSFLKISIIAVFAFPENVKGENNAYSDIVQTLPTSGKFFFAELFYEKA